MNDYDRLIRILLKIKQSEKLSDEDLKEIEKCIKLVKKVEERSKARTLLLLLGKYFLDFFKDEL